MSRDAGAFRVLVGIGVAVAAVGLLGFAGLRWLRPSGVPPARTGVASPDASSRSMRGLRGGPDDGHAAGVAAGALSTGGASATARSRSAAEAAARDAADRFIRIRLGGAAEAATVGEVHVRDRGDGTYTATVAVSVPDDRGVRRQRYDLRVAPGDGAEVDSNAMNVSLERAPVTLTDAEWARLDRALQERVTGYVRDTTYGQIIGVKVNATPLGRGRYDVVVLVPDTTAPNGRRADFLIATFDPGSDGWMVVSAP